MFAVAPLHTAESVVDSPWLIVLRVALKDEIVDRGIVVVVTVGTVVVDVVVDEMVVVVVPAEFVIG